MRPPTPTPGPPARDGDLAGVGLTTDRLVLRPWTAADAGPVAAILGGGGLHEFLPLPAPYTPAAAEAFVTGAAQAERRAGTGLDCAVEERASGRLVGSASVRLPVSGRPCDIGYWVAGAAQRRGYAAEAAAALAAWAMDRGVPRVEIHADVANLASVRVALRAGFVFEAVRRDGLQLRGSRRDLAVCVRRPGDADGPVPPAFTPLPDAGLTDGVVLLRASLPADAAGFVEQEADELTRRMGFTGDPPDRSAIEHVLARARLDWLVGTAAPVTIVDVATGAFAGSLRLRKAGPPRIGGLGYAVHPAFRGRRYTARALRLLATWAFGPGGFARLELGAKTANVASQRAALAAGFAPDGVLRARLRNPDGTFSDEARFALVNPALR